MSVTKAQQEMYTPCKAQKCLFGPSNGSSSKKSIQRSGGGSRGDCDSSGDDSDLGPMTPLTFTDRSPSSLSSSPMQYESPWSTPEKRSVVSEQPWDRLTPNSKRSHHSLDLSFSNLKKITKAARYFPRMRLPSLSPKSTSTSPTKRLESPDELKESEATVIADEIIPETPRRSFGKELQNDITDTPCKQDESESRLITPMGSGGKRMSLPKLNKRKSFCMIDAADYCSPDRKENLLKRHAQDTLGGVALKLLKTDENYSVPKARAALFQEKERDSKSHGLTLSAKSFYKSSETREVGQRICVFKQADPTKRRKSLPAQSSHGKKTFRRHTFGRINAGVSHGIKRPRSKAIPNSSKENSLNNSKKVESPSNNSVVIDDTSNTNSLDVSLERPQSPEIDPNKRFFKTKKPIQYNVTVTVNDKIKLKVTKDKIVRNESQKVLNARKRQKLKHSSSASISYDASDLAVDEPDIEASRQECRVENILKVLEDDWADDDYDTLEPLTNQKTTPPESPKTSGLPPNDNVMSPASELSNMTSTMNIGDITAPSNFENLSLNDVGNNNDTASTEQRYFPIFAKGYSVKNSGASESTQSPRNGKKQLSWQLSTKAAGGENQYQIDAGQKRFGAIQCTECKLIYQVGEPEDESAHLNYHNSRITLKFTGWKTERVVYEDSISQSRIILVEPGDSKQCWNKVTNILKVVDRDLGLSDAEMSEYENKKVYLYIRDKNVIGVLVAEHIQSAYRMIPELLELDCCTAEAVSAKCGINVIWTVVSHRHQGIATKLVDTLRAQFYYGYVMSVDDIAFSIPTPSGKKFAEKYTKTRSFKVYN